MDALLSVLFISFPTDTRKGTYCILNDMSFCTLSFLFYLCRVNIKKSKMERHPVILSIAGSGLFGRRRYSGRHKNNLGFRRLCSIGHYCYHRTKHTGGTCRTVHFSGYGSWANRSRDGRPATGCHQNRNDK